ncbi:MAG: TonB-dependent receptor [Bacteroidales bacterium]|nr:TonB-dependent receptor [Bacteroidales bacterium]
MKKLLLIITIFISASCVFGQDKNLSIRFNRILFSDLVDTLEKSIPVKIYYSNKWVDTLLLSVDSENEKFEDLLGKSLGKSGFSFIITEGNKVILSKGYSIKTNFQKEYLEYLKKNYASTDTSEFVRPVVRQEKSSISDEYKVFRIGKQAGSHTGDKVTLSGTVISSVDGEFISGAIVYVEKLKAGAMTNNSGYYSVTLPAGQYQIEYRMVGMKTTRRNAIIYSDGALDVEMSENTNQLNEIVVSANRENMVKNVRIGIEKINTKMLKQIPMGMGEADIIKSSLLLPGVQTVGEASSGYNVRGGSADQNLVLLNNAPIINSSHFFGFFSAFNSDLISDVTLYKSGMPSKYGGRLSSVMEIAPLEGNRERVKVSGGVSPVTGRILVEGPVKKGKGSFIIGTRATYSDWILGMLDDPQLQKSSAGFYDVQGIINTEINARNSISLSGYYSKDKFDYFSVNAFDYRNLASTLKWKHIFNPKLSAQFYGIVSNYDYHLNENQDSTDYSSTYYKLDQRVLRADFLYFPVAKHKVEFGLDAIYYSLLPGVRTPVGDYSVTATKRIEKEHALEPALYLSDEFEVNQNLSVSGGIRGTLFTSFGPKTEFQYFENTSRTVESISDTIIYGDGKIIKVYPGLEFRVSSRLILSPESSLKIGVQRVYQYIHMISNTTSMSPTDIWKLSDSYIKPQMGDQFSLGFYKNFSRKAVEASIETYYKKITNILDYKGGAVLLMNDHLETDIINGNGKAYGVELMVKKQSGKLTGWISYTYSRTLVKVDGEFEEEKVNGGQYFPANFDKPHDLKAIANAKLSRRINVTSNFSYSTGRPITFPVAFYNFNGTNRVYYSKRNEYRIPDYIRLDLSATLNGNLRAEKLNHSSLTFTVYNVLGRKNPYSIYFKNEGGIVNGYKMSIFGQPIFMVTYNFKIFGNASGDF